MNHTKRESKIISKYDTKFNKIKMSLIECQLLLSFYKKNGNVSSRFYTILKEKYPKIYIEIRDECINRFGKPLTKNESIKKEINKFSNTSKGIMIKKIMKRKFKIKKENLK